MGHYYHWLLFVPLCGASLAADMHVSPTGSDDHAGTSAAPVQTLEKARVLAQVLRKGHPAEAVNMLLHPLRQQTESSARPRSGCRDPATPITTLA